jgi:NAD(P)-dependent dehydrogenase (short-subunit alcohol dehydrogenase family)
MAEGAKRVVVVTGATGAIGRAIVGRLAARPECEVVLIARNDQRASAAVREIQKKTGNRNVRHLVCDLSRKTAIEALGQRWQGPLHVLINNAATAPRRREVTPEGIERQFATNVLGYFWMMRALTPALSRGAPARIVNVASYWAGDLDLDDLEFVRRPYDNDTAYRQSKQADRMLTVACAPLLEPIHITVNACHPGDVSSKLSRDLGFGGHQSAEQAADTPVWLATEEVGQRLSGGYFQHRRESVCHFGRQQAAVERLYQICDSY